MDSDSPQYLLNPALIERYNEDPSNQSICAELFRRFPYPVEAPVARPLPSACPLCQGGARCPHCGSAKQRFGCVRNRIYLAPCPACGSTEHVAVFERGRKESAALVQAALGKQADHQPPTAAELERLRSDPDAFVEHVLGAEDRSLRAWWDLWLRTEPTHRGVQAGKSAVRGSRLDTFFVDSFQPKVWPKPDREWVEADLRGRSVMGVDYGAALASADMFLAELRDKPWESLWKQREARKNETLAHYMTAIWMGGLKPEPLSAAVTARRAALFGPYVSPATIQMVEPPQERVPLSWAALTAGARSMVNNNVPPALTVVVTRTDRRDTRVVRIDMYVCHLPPIDRGELESDPEFLAAIERGAAAECVFDSRDEFNPRPRGHILFGVETDITGQVAQWTADPPTEVDIASGIRQRGELAEVHRLRFRFKVPVHPQPRT